MIENEEEVRYWCLLLGALFISSDPVVVSFGMALWMETWS